MNDDRFNRALLLLIVALTMLAMALTTPTSPPAERQPDPHHARGSVECLRQGKEYVAALMVQAPDAEKWQPMAECQ